MTSCFRKRSFSRDAVPISMSIAFLLPTPCLKILSGVLDFVWTTGPCRFFCSLAALWCYLLAGRARSGRIWSSEGRGVGIFQHWILERTARKGSTKTGIHWFQMGWFWNLDRPFEANEPLHVFVLLIWNCHWLPWSLQGFVCIAGCKLVWELVELPLLWHLWLLLLVSRSRNLNKA